MQSTRTLMFAGLAAAGLALAGCGGGGSSTPTALTDEKKCTADGGMYADGKCTTAAEALAKRQSDQRSAISSAISRAGSLVAAIDNESTDAEVSAATMAVSNARAAISAAADLSEDEKAGNTASVNTIAGQLSSAESRRTTAMNKANEAEQKATTATAKALKKAIDIAKLDASNAATNVSVPTMIPVLDVDGDGTVNTDLTGDITLKKGDAVGSLGNWKGTDYAGAEATTGDLAKNTGMVRVYDNQGAAKSVTFASEAGRGVHNWALATSTTTVDDDYTVVTTAAAQQKAVGGFPTTGTTSYSDQTVDGTFMGASGTYTCAVNCTAVVTADGVNLGTGWTFKPAPGATLQQADASYLQFGWWIRKDKDGPTHAGAFYREVMPTGGTTTLVTNVNNAALVGKATYTGAAAGKFAISDPLRPAYDNAGHFTADAELMADFKVTGSTLSGTIDAFRLNDGSVDPGWSVELQKTVWDGGTSKFVTNATRDDDQTVWSIGEGKGVASGSWEAQIYDEKPGPAPAGDGSNVPTSVLGSFESSIGATHSMVGAFGATKE